LDETVRRGTAYIGNFLMTRMNEFVVPWNGCTTMPMASELLE
jgi:hypothetical protein